MNGCHASLRDDFEVSSSALDGFVVCAVALLQVDHDDFLKTIVACYAEMVGKTAVFYPIP